MWPFLSFPQLYDDVLELRIMHYLPENRELGYVPSYVYGIYERGNPEIIGIIDLRIGHNENTHFGGHIGYRIYEDYRGHGYAGRACHLLVPVALAHDMHTLRITCNPDNLASRRTIEKLGATLIEIANLPPHNEMYKRGEPVKCLFDWQIAPDDAQKEEE